MVPGSGSVPEGTIQAVRRAAELLNGGASLGENGEALAAIAIQRALACCQRRDVPEDMVQAVGALALALYWTIPQNGGAEAGQDTEDFGESSGEDSGASGSASSAGGPDWEALLAAGAIKSIQRGDTAITFSSGGSAAVSAALSQSAAHPTVDAALAGLSPWRRLGRLRSSSLEKKNQRVLYPAGGEGL